MTGVQTCALPISGLSRINQSIEAFVYCILGAQVNVRSSILREGGRAKEAQMEFLKLMEDAIRQPDLAKSVQRYQLAVDEAKVQLNLAVCPGAWLMPARIIINTESTIGYNNKLMQAKAGMKLGINNDVNSGTQKSGTAADGWGAIKNKPAKQPPFKPNPQSRHGCTISAARFEKKNYKQASEKLPIVSEKPTIDVSEKHEISKTVVIIGVVGVVALLFMASR